VLSAAASLASYISLSCSETKPGRSQKKNKIMFVNSFFKKGNSIRVLDGRYK
jgi:hypothetical protein